MLKEFSILSRFGEEYVNPHDVYQSNGFSFSRATFYRKLDKLKELGLIEWRVGKARLTEKGLKVLAVLNGNYDRALIDEKTKELTNQEPASGPEVMTQPKGESSSFKIFECEELKKHIDDSFVFVEYPTASYILKALLIVAGIEEKGLKTNVEKFRALKEADFKVKLAINHFENASKQVLVFLDELIKLGKISALYCGVKNERRALANKKLVEFWQDWNFENERFKLPKESVTLFPLFLIAVIGVILIVALRSGYEHASILAILTVVYFMRSMLFKEIREL